jgi:hypothetical protein
VTKVIRACRTGGPPGSSGLVADGRAGTSENVSIGTTDAVPFVVGRKRRCRFEGEPPGCGSSVGDLRGQRFTNSAILQWARELDRGGTTRASSWAAWTM